MRKNPAQKRLISSERDEQAAVVQWLRIKSIPFIAHMTGAPLHGNFALINMLKQVGCLQAGIPDLQIPVPAGGNHGLFIELKRERGGVLSPEQRQWLNDRAADGYVTAVCKGADEAIEVIKGYLEG